MKRPVILNSEGNPIVLNQREQMIANNVQKSVNSLGYEVDITTLTTIMKKITDQKFHEIAFADYLPVRVGEGAWSTQLTTYRSFALGDDFESGLLNTGANNSRMATAEAGIDSLSIPVRNWAKQVGWSLFDLQFASKSGNWDLVTAKERARKKNWDIGLQKVAFLGTSAGDKGLLNQVGVTPNTTLIAKSIKEMNETELSAFLKSLLSEYRTRNAYTAMPTHFIIPESDYLGLATPSSSDFPLKSKLQVIRETLATMTGKKDFEILPLSYAQASINEAAGINKDRYVLLNYEEESLRMDIPVDYTNTLANSIDNFNFQNVGYGQFTGVLAYRPLELMYIDLTTGG